MEAHSRVLRSQANHREREIEKLIPSAEGRGGNWVHDVQRDVIRVRALKPKGDGSPQPLRKSTFYREWKQLTTTGSSSNNVRQVVWDILVECFDDVERYPGNRETLYWPRFPISRR
jgi:hypothetical protein